MQYMDALWWVFAAAIVGILSSVVFMTLCIFVGWKSLKQARRMRGDVDAEPIVPAADSEPADYAEDFGDDDCPICNGDMVRVERQRVMQCQKCAYERNIL